MTFFQILRRSQDFGNLRVNVTVIATSKVGLFLLARRYASTVLTVIVCPSVRQTIPEMGVVTSRDRL